MIRAIGVAILALASIGAATQPATQPKPTQIQAFAESLPKNLWPKKTDTEFTKGAREEWYAKNSKGVTVSATFQVSKVTRDGVVVGSTDVKWFGYSLPVQIKATPSNSSGLESLKIKDSVTVVGGVESFVVGIGSQIHTASLSGCSVSKN